MATSSQRQMIKLILWSLGWGLALIASAILFKNKPAKDWIQSILFLGAVTSWLWQSQRLARPHC